MAKSTKRHSAGVTAAADRSSTLVPNRWQPTEGDIAHRAYHFYLARGCEHGRDVEDWLKAESELRRVVSVAGR